MTRLQIEALRNKINNKYNSWQDKRSEEDAAVLEELSCREMINSILIYGGGLTKGTYNYDRYLLPYTQKGTWHDGLISVGMLEQLIAEQKADFAKADVGFAGYDSEGVSYNYCTWEDEK